jgi:hypothetical protein
VESFFNFAWAVIGAIFLAAGFLFRWRVATWARRAMARDLMLLGLIAALLFPIISISDDIGYFSYYFSGGQSPEGIFWVKGSRREKQSHLPVIPLTFAFLLNATAAVVCQRTTLETIAPAGPAGIFSRRLTASYLRAPPVQA